MARVIHDDSRVVRDSGDSPVNDGLWIVARIVSIIAGIIIGILAIRFLLVLLGANAQNGFASFIYDISQPFVSPFFGLFNYTPSYANSRIEFETLIAIAVYWLVAWLITRALTISSRRDIA